MPSKALLFTLLIAAAAVLKAQEGAPVIPGGTQEKLEDKGVVKKASRSLPQGVIVMTLNPDCPGGYHREGRLEGRFVKGAGAEEAPGKRGGAAAHSHKAVLDLSHSHEFSGATEAALSGNPARGGREGGETAGAEHTHDFSGTTSATKDAKRTVTTEAASSEPPYTTVLFCSKD